MLNNATLDVLGGLSPHDDAYIRLTPDTVDRLIQILESAKRTGREEVEMFDSHGEAYTLKIQVIEDDKDTLVYPTGNQHSLLLEDA